MAYSPDGAIIRSAGPEGLREWDAESGRRRGSVDRSPSPPVAVRHLPGGVVEADLGPAPDAWTGVGLARDGKPLTSTRKRIIEWDLRTGREARATGTPFEGAGPCAFSPDGASVAVPDGEGLIRLLDAKTGREVRSLSKSHRELSCLEFSPSGERLAAGDRADRLLVWNTKTGELLHQAKAGGRILSLAFSPKETHVASGGDDEVIRLWDLYTGKEAARLACAAEVAAVAYAPDGSRLASGSSDGGVRLWELPSGQERWSGMHSSSGEHSGAVLAVAFSPDGRRVAAGGRDGRMSFWDAATGAPAPSVGHQNEITALGFSPDGSRLLSADFDGKVSLWEAASGRELWTAKEPKAPRGAAFSPDGREIAIDDGGAFLRIREAVGGKERLKMPGDAQVVHYVPDGSSILWGDGKGLLHFLDPSTGRERRVLKTREKEFHALAVSPDGTRIAEGGNPCRVALWDAATGNELGSEEDEASQLVGALNRVAFSPDGRDLATARFSVVRMREGRTGRTLWSLTLEDDEFVTGLGFIPGGRLVAGTTAGLVFIDPAERKILLRHRVEDGVARMALSPDGRRCATGGETGVVLVWDVDALLRVPTSPK
jgi:WD40 repeat protein